MQLNKDNWVDLDPREQFALKSVGPLPLDSFTQTAIAATIEEARSRVQEVPDLRLTHGMAQKESAAREERLTRLVNFEETYTFALDAFKSIGKIPVKEPNRTLTFRR